MSNTDRNILRRMKELGQAQLSPEEIQQMIAGVRATLVDQNPADTSSMPDQPSLRSVPEASYGSAETAQQGAVQDSSRRPTKRWTMHKLVLMTGAAAIVCVVVSVIFLSSSQQAANAAQMLQQVVATNSAYKGWVHIRCSVTGSQEKQDAEVVDHVNKADGTRVFVARTPEEFRVIHQSLAHGESTTYSSKTNELRTSPLNKLTTLNLRESLAEVFLSPDEVLGFLSAAGSTTHRVSVTREDGSNRFDITSIDLSSRSPGSQPAGRTMAGMVVRVDAVTGLISQAQVKYSDSTALILDMTYGQPEISSVYDVGVPRDAKVVDNRPDQTVQTILDSMAAQRELDAGDYVAVMTEDLLVPEINDVMPAGMTLYAQTGNSWLWADYRIQDLPPGYPAVRRGWPASYSTGCAGTPAASETHRLHRGQWLASLDNESLDGRCCA